MDNEYNRRSNELYNAIIRQLRKAGKVTALLMLNTV